MDNLVSGPMAKMVPADCAWKMTNFTKLLLMSDSYLPEMVMPGPVHLVKALDSYQVCIVRSLNIISLVTQLRGWVFLNPHLSLIPPVFTIPFPYGQIWANAIQRVNIAQNKQCLGSQVLPNSATFYCPALVISCFREAWRLMIRRYNDV